MSGAKDLVRSVILTAIAVGYLPVMWWSPRSLLV